MSLPLVSILREIPDDIRDICETSETLPTEDRHKMVDVDFSQQQFFAKNSDTKI